MNFGVNCESEADDPRLGREMSKGFFGVLGACPEEEEEDPVLSDKAKLSAKMEVNPWDNLFGFRASKAARICSKFKKRRCKERTRMRRLTPAGREWARRPKKEETKERRKPRVN